MSENIRAVKITMMKNGMFQRLIDTWSYLGASLAFSQFIPIFEGDKINIQQNKAPIVKQGRCFDLGDLLTFDPYEYERKYWKDFGKRGLDSEWFLQKPNGKPIRYNEKLLHTIRRFFNCEISPNSLVVDYIRSE